MVDNQNAKFRLIKSMNYVKPPNLMSRYSLPGLILILLILITAMAILA